MIEAIVEEAHGFGSKKYLGKTCIKCDSRERWRSNGSCVYCTRKFTSKYMPLYIERNKGKLLASRRQWNHNNPEKAMIQRARRRARQLGVPFMITWQDIKIPDECPVLNITLDRCLGQDNAPSLDRVRNSEGYVVGNVIVVSHRVNRIKSDASIDELIAISRYYECKLEDSHSYDRSDSDTRQY